MITRIWTFAILGFLLAHPGLAQEKAADPLRGFPLSDSVGDVLTQLKAKHLKVLSKEIEQETLVYEQHIERYGLFCRKCRVVWVPRVLKSTRTVRETKEGFDGGLGWNEPNEPDPSNMGLAISRQSPKSSISPKLAGLRASRVKDLCLNYLTATLKIPPDQLEWKIDSDLEEKKDLALVIAQHEFIAVPGEITKERSFRVFATVDAITFNVVALEIQEQQRLRGLDNTQKKDPKFYDPGVQLKATTDLFMTYLANEAMKVADGK